ncbi:MAG: hypothetical protein LBV50_08030 [Novosphingobium sp.]|jgi:hypothetical protein|nr:hypothetical protein [Novosphingobium sp.]
MSALPARLDAAACDATSDTHASPFRVAIAGEFNSGKSSLINLLLRRELLRVGPTYSHMPPVRIHLQGGEPSGPEPDDAAASGSGAIDMNVPCAALAGITISEVSADESGHLTPQAEAELLAADMIVWCTIGPRAWTLSEIDIVENLPRDRFAGALLAVTRSDLLTPAERDTVLSRIRPMTQDYFDEILMVEASGETIRRSAEDLIWRRSAGEALCKAVRRRHAAWQAAPPPAPAPAPANDSPGMWAAAMAEVERQIAASLTLAEGSIHREIRHRLSAIVQLRPAQGADPAPSRIFRQALDMLDRCPAGHDRDEWALDIALQLLDRPLGIESAAVPAPSPPR